jgi:hypothetical protein
MLCKLKICIQAMKVLCRYEGADDSRAYCVDAHKQFIRCGICIRQSLSKSEFCIGPGFDLATELASHMLANHTAGCPQTVMPVILCLLLAVRCAHYVFVVLFNSGIQT